MAAVGDLPTIQAFADEIRARMGNVEKVLQEQQINDPKRYATKDELESSTGAIQAKLESTTTAFQTQFQEMKELMIKLQEKPKGQGDVHDDTEGPETKETAK